LLAAVDARRRGADIVHIMNLSQFAPVFRRALPTAKIVIHMACEWLTQIDAATVSRRLRSIDLVAGCSDYITELVRARHRDYAGTFQTLYNGVDPDDFAAEQKSADDKGPVLLFVGRVSPEKGVHVLIEAMPAVLAKHPRTRLQIVGGHGQLRRDYLVALSTDPSVRALERYYDGDRRDAYISALKTRIKELNLGAHVCLVGAVDYPEIPARYAGADVLVNPALSESFGRSLIEAMAAGVPVVAADAGGAREVAGDGRCGVVVPRGDTDALAAGILRVLDDPATNTKLVRAGRNRVAESFTWDRVADSAAACYRRLLATKKAA
jgi:glycosyltransferase involved in cell wall biosynthesis